MTIKIKIRFTILLLSIIILLTQIQAQAEINFEESELFLKNKAEIKYYKSGNEKIREVYLKGFRISDLEISQLSKDKELFIRTEKTIQEKRIKDSLVTFLGLPTGALLLYIATLNRDNQKIPNTPIRLNNNPVYDAGTFLLSMGGTIIFLYAIVNSFYLVSEVSGIKPIMVLKDDEVEDIIKNYNLELKRKILNQEKINIFFNDYLFSESNNIMIFSISKTF
ncbi:MAG: hypothetical protein U0457_16255 [Candidatus Sericytochromatia bacterium]